MACPQFGNHAFSPLDVSRFDHQSCFDPVIFIGRGTRTVELIEEPVTIVPPGELTERVPILCVPLEELKVACPAVKLRKKPKFIDSTSLDIEMYPVNVFKHYEYAID
eukprot:13088256-Heterocapsa_arctica.AAC.1